jgi:hypothetical protein
VGRSLNDNQTPSCTKKVVEEIAAEDKRRRKSLNRAKSGSDQERNRGVEPCSRGGQSRAGNGGLTVSKAPIGLERGMGTNP